jgi:hypothetical protein
MRCLLPLTISEAEEKGLRRLMAEGDKGEYGRSSAIIGLKECQAMPSPVRWA